jgi:hypothetical protein
MAKRIFFAKSKLPNIARTKVAEKTRESTVLVFIPYSPLF